ncbi:hypothetical protein DMX06_03175 [Pseudomonas mosselii]|nr:hypothetical protein DMX06_03175 [Pseudomonas mosselii]
MYEKPPALTGRRFFFARTLTRAPVGAALRRERAAQQPQDFSIDAKIAGAALQPFRDTRPLLQGSCKQEKSYWVSHPVTRKSQASPLICR